MIKKNIIQIFLIVLLIILSLFFYQKYMVTSKSSKKFVEEKVDTKITNENIILEENKDTANIIENLKYTSTDLFGNTYIINANSAQVEEGKINC